MMALGHAGLIGIEVGVIRGEAMRALDVDQCEPVPKRCGIVRAAQQSLDACR
jgi:hypothetical protein